MEVRVNVQRKGPKMTPINKYLEFKKATPKKVVYSDGDMSLYLGKEEVDYPNHPEAILLTIQSQ